LVREAATTVRSSAVVLLDDEPLVVSCIEDIRVPSVVVPIVPAEHENSP
jgi:hypothetical protein